MKILICAGGTGGGVYPALSVHDALKSLNPDIEILWVGGEGGLEAGLVQRAGIPFKAIPAAGVHGIALKQLPLNLLTIIRGIINAKKILDESKPDALFFTGGFVAIPAALAGWKIPSLLYVPDIEPGMALKFLSRFSKIITLTADESKKYFADKNKLTVTGYPVRAGLSTWDKASARQHLHIPQDRKTLLVFGGSLGARSINTALLTILKSLLPQMDVVHISGKLDWPTVEKNMATLSEEEKSHYHAFPYLHEDMGAALASADLVISRAGASSLGEFPQFSLPAILVPYPHAWRYQKINAESLSVRGAAKILEDARLGEELYPTIMGILNSPDKLAMMADAMRKYRTGDAAKKIASLLISLAGGQK